MGLMRRYGLLLTLVAALVLACSGTLLAQSTTPDAKQQTTPEATQSKEQASSERSSPSAQAASAHLAAPGQSKHVCPVPDSPKKVRCLSKVRNDVQPAASTPFGYRPADLQSAYQLSNDSSTKGTGATIAIVDAFDDPSAESDLATYRSQFSLPPCTTANGCFKKVNQNGGTTSYPSPNQDWGLEISLDLDAISALCPNCNILLVEANSNSLADLAAAVDYAASVPGVVAISNSYGGDEFSGETSYEASYNHPGIAITVSSGDSGYGVMFPAASRYVTAVGGTSLTGSSGSWSESAWNGAGSGCSAYITKPSWQTDSGCNMRAVADVAADADPNAGMAVYDSYGWGGWNQVGGTSLASPLIASVYALGGNSSSILYQHTSDGTLFDVTSGSNGTCSPNNYLCNAGTGYDGPTGLGTPHGAGAFGGNSTTPSPSPPPPTVGGGGGGGGGGHHHRRHHHHRH